MKIRKKIALLFSVIVMAILFAVSANAGIVGLDATGQCGDNVYWEFNENTGELTLTGEGATWDYEPYKSPLSFRRSIKSIVIEDGITEIGDALFFDCYMVKALIISESVTSIGEYAFYSIEELESVTISENVHTIGDFAFAMCFNLQYFEVDENNENYSNDSLGVLFNKDKSVLIQYPLGKKMLKYTVPETVTTICDYAFYGNTIYCFSHFTEITIHENVEYVGIGAFATTPFLDKMIIKGMDTDLGEYSVCASEFYVTGISQEEFIELSNQYIETEDEEILAELEEKYIVWEDLLYFVGTIYCHTGSTAEAYAIENNVNYVLTHFYEDEWTYDYENMVRYHKCMHCDEASDSEGFIPSESVEEPDAEIDMFAMIFEWLRALFDLVQSWFK